MIQGGVFLKRFIFVINALLYWKMKIRLLLLIFLFASNLFAKSPDPIAVKGILDLREIQNSKNFIINLNGEWEFYWKRMMHPHDFNGVKTSPDYYGKVPSYWTDYPQEQVKTEKFGYATYRLTILLPPGYRDALGIDLPVFDSSYDIYLNGKYLGGSGTVGKLGKSPTLNIKGIFSGSCQLQTFWKL